MAIQWPKNPTQRFHEADGPGLGRPADGISYRLVEGAQIARLDVDDQ